MLRNARLDAPGSLHQVILRGLERGSIRVVGTPTHDIPMEAEPGIDLIDLFDQVRLGAGVWVANALTVGGYQREPMQVAGARSRRPHRAAAPTPPASRVGQHRRRRASAAHHGSTAMRTGTPGPRVRNGGQAPAASGSTAPSDATPARPAPPTPDRIGRKRPKPGRPTGQTGQQYGPLSLMCPCITTMKVQYCV